MFDPSRYYFTDDSELLDKLRVTCSTMAKWRHYGTGPAFHKFGKRIAYAGTDLNAWIVLQRRPAMTAA